MTSSRIARVRVFRTGATITRTVKLTTVPEHIELTGLPLCLSDASVRVRVSVDTVRAGAPTIGLFAKPPADLPEPPDEEALRLLRRGIQRDENLIEALRAEMELLSEVTVPARPRAAKGQAPPASPMPARVALERFTHTSIDTRLERVRSLETALAEKRREESALAHQLAQASRKHLADRQTVSKAIRVPLTGTGEQVTVEVDYYVPGARWAPTYQCHVDTRTGSTRLHQRAVVSQNSGEDWSQVRLELSTALPQSFSILPKLASIRIGKAQQPVESPGFRPPPTGGLALFADYDRAPKPQPQRTQRGFDWSTNAAPAVLGFADLEMGAPADAYVEEVELADDDCFDEAPAAPKMMSMPAPAAAAPPRAERRTRSAAPSKKKMRKPSALSASFGGAPGAAAPPAIPAFANLRLAAASSRERGRLTPSDPLSDYRASLARLTLSLDQDLQSLLRQAHQRAANTASLSLPPGTTDLSSGAGAFDYTLRTEHPIDVPSDNTFHSIPLATHETTADLTYVVVPRVDPNVFRVAAIHNPSDAPMLAGPVEVYVGGRYVLSSQLPMVPPHGAFRLGLGVEQGVRCARNTHYREARSGTAVVAMNELHHTVEITLHNQLDRPIRAEVRERLPAPAKDAEVAVEEVSIEPPWEPWDQRKVGGSKLAEGRRWQIAVPPGERTTLKAHYVVKIYANNEIAGGNRREA